MANPFGLSAQSRFEIQSAFVGPGQAANPAGTAQSEVGGRAGLGRLSLEQSYPTPPHRHFKRATQRPGLEDYDPAADLSHQPAI